MSRRHLFDPPALASHVEVPMPQHAVSIRPKTDYWPMLDHDNVMRARRLYDEGKYEMCQGRVGEYFVLYAIPRKVRTNPRKYFSYSGTE